MLSVPLRRVGDVLHVIVQDAHASRESGSQLERDIVHCCPPAIELLILHGGQHSARSRVVADRLRDERLATERAGELDRAGRRKPIESLLGGQNAPEVELLESLLSDVSMSWRKSCC